jgi:site-specific DNA recombinase
MTTNMDWRSYANNKGIGIIRRSHARQIENCSVEIQKAEIQKWADEQGITVCKYIEFIESSKDSAYRKKYNLAMGEAQKSGASHCFFYMPDREARNLTNVEQNQVSVLRGDIVIHYVRDRKILHKYSSESDFQLREFQAVMDKSFSRKLSIRTKDSQAHKIGNGDYPGNKAPLGYIIQKSKDHSGRELKRGATLAIDSSENDRNWVIHEFKLYAEGYSFKAIRDACVDAGFVDSNKLLSYRPSSIEKRIKNPIYFGKFRWEKKIYDGRHKLLMPPDILKAVKSRITGGKVYGKRNFGENGLFANSWLMCGDANCGCAISYDPKTKIIKTTGREKIYSYYHCANGRGVHGNLKKMNITEERLWERLEKSLDEITITKMFAKQVAEALNQSHSDACAATNAEIDMFDSRLKEIEGRGSKLVDAVLDGLIDRDQLVQKKSELDSEKNKILERMRIAQLAITGRVSETAKTILELAIDAKSLWKEQSPRERLEFLKLILSNPTWDGVSVRYELKKPFALLREMKGLEDWRPLGNSNPRLLREREMS